MIQYRRSEPSADDDLEGITTVEKSIDVVTDFKSETVRSMTHLLARFPDLSERDLGRCQRLFASYPNLHLTVRRMGP